MDGAGLDRPHHRTALVRRVLGRYGIEMAALGGTRFAEIGGIKKVGAGPFFWSARKSEERREAGVGFAIKSNLVGKLSGLPNCINDRYNGIKTSFVWQ